jgi:predicted enzyme related to lactoylglutathione lyase
MLTLSSLIAIVPVLDMVRAREFYESKLGLKALGAQTDGGIVYGCGGGAMLELCHQPGSAKADYAIASFEVDDIKAEIRALEHQGVIFEDYDQPDLRTVRHIAKIGDEKEAWFKDTEGNYLCLHQE